jgi:hypothetical protein
LDNRELCAAPSIKDFITGLAEIKTSGPFLSFSVFHLFYALELMSKRRVGRDNLAVKLNVGGGAVRTILNRLVSGGLVRVSRAGCVLTSEGLAVWRELERIFPKRTAFSATELSSFPFNYAYLVKNCGDKVGSGMEQRDAAIVAGALSGLVIIFRGGRLCINSVCDDVGAAFPDASGLIVRELGPVENDVVVISGGESFAEAMSGAFAASWSLIGGKRVRL